MLTSSAKSSSVSALSTSVNAAQWITASGWRSPTWSNTACALVRSRSGRSVPKTSWPRSRPAATTRWPSMPLAPVTSKRMGSEDPDLGVVAHHEVVGAGLAVGARDLDVAAEQRALHPPLEADDRRALEQDRVLDLGPLDLALLADRRVRPDVAVGQSRAGADDRRAADHGALQPRARLDDHAPVDLRVDELAVDAGDERVEDEPIGLEHVLEAAGVLPPAAHDVRLDALAVVDEVLDRVGDLELAPRRRLDRARGVVDAGGEHVDADQREVSLRLVRLLGQPDHAAVLQLGHAIV